MKNSSFKRSDCRLCGGCDLELVLQLKATPIEDDYVFADRLDEVQETYPLDLYLCNGCSHVQLLDVVSPELMFSDYTYMTSISLGLVEHFRRYVNELLERFNPPEGSLVVDIGSNDGTSLKFFKERGMRVLGIDPAREIAKRATEAGIETLPNFFSLELASDIKRKYGPAAIITANNVYAHADNLVDITNGIRELLSGDGVFIFEVSYLVDIVQKVLFDTIYHEHLCYHSVKPLDSFLTSRGMQLIDIQRINTKGGSIRGTAQIAGGPRTLLPVVNELISLEKSLNFHLPEPYMALSAELKTIKNEFIDVMRDLKSKGKIIAGYGASATTTVLLHYLELGDVLSFIVDDNPRKKNTFSPGHHIPVLPSEELYRQKVDYVVIMAWNYADPIMKRHEKFIDQGGHFVIPMPKIKVI